MQTPLLRTFFFVSLTTLGSAYAQILPDAGAVLQQTEPERMPLPQAQPPLPVDEAVPATATPGVQIRVQAFRFAGNSLLSDAQLQEAVSEYVDRDLGFDDLQRAVLAVSTLYRQAGWVVRAFLPRQDVTEGNVLIQVEEARFGTTRLEGEAPERLTEQVWQATVRAAQREDEPLSAPALDRALLLLGDLPGIVASGSLAPGARPGETDLLLKLDDEALVTGSFGADNHGLRSTGAERLTTVIAVNSPLQQGDRLLANLLYTDGNSYGRLAYSVPVGDSGLRIGANVSNLDYRLVGNEFAAFDAEGSSFSWGLEASYPLQRSRQQNLYLVANADRKRFDNEANGITTARYDVDLLGLGLVGNRYDSFAGGGASEASLLLSSGRVKLDDNALPRADRSEGDFTKLRFGLARHQFITPSLSAYAAVSSQWSDGNLDSSERFYLGGDSGVRAYPVNEGGGSWGQLVNLELRQRLMRGFLLTGFVDYGRIRQYADDYWVGGQRLSGEASNSLAYKGYGLSLGWSGPHQLQLKATWAHRIGSNPDPAVNGLDQDGSLDRDRFWLSAAMPFELGRSGSASK